MFCIRSKLPRLATNIYLHFRLYSDSVKWKSVHLTNRSLIRIEGAESAGLLQGLVTNDINGLVDKEYPSMYCMFLNSAGRVLFDSIISPGFEPNQFFLEVDQAMSKNVIKHLSMYRVRRKIAIEPVSELKVYSVFHEDLKVRTESNLQTRSSHLGSTFCDGGVRNSVLPPVSNPTSICFPDPRVDLLGYRYIGPDHPESNLNFSLEQGTVLDYNIQRCVVGVTEGSGDIPPTKALPLEYNLDYLHGVNFHKGCYIGQELTARTHHTGIIRKRILPIKFGTEDHNIELDSTIVNESGKNVGKIRKTEGKHGLAMVRLAEAFSSASLKCGEVSVSVWKPVWWPQEKDEKKGSN
ncbi:putative transferase CAF17 homolog, mitochondrial [Eurytemora carolleeae]|uniref:putative transferase CAF17 homolog, mitochondrial n=1 Tax=Eurytemora carolleeae TaxID=1294199 RepID=UPI000C7587FB|nr:putative transferase CAF17 homolog, mitochondrial [Eurytemora carolleeae]|eukprot:XP_023320087.1 putative transferase CAF17 homolog, mitochondrial [Eurytemora affinis]